MVDRDEPDIRLEDVPLDVPVDTEGRATDDVDDDTRRLVVRGFGVAPAPALADDGNEDREGDFA